MRHRMTFAVLSIITSLLVLSGGYPIASSSERSRVADGGLIAFTRYLKSESRYELFTIRPDGTGIERITESAITESFLDASPSGLAVAFGGSGVGIVDLDGSQRSLTSADGARSPTWSPDGRWLAYYGKVEGCASCPKGILKIKADGSRGQRLTQGSSYRDPDWSPDGNRFVVSRSFRDHGEIYVINADGSAPSPLTAQGGYQIAGPRWSPDGSQVAFVGVGRPLSDPTIFVVDSGGGEPLPLSRFNDLHGLSWSPDGSRLVAAGEGFNSVEGLYVIDVGSGDAMLLRRLSGLRSVTWLPEPRGACDIVGTHRSDLLLGTARSEVICGFAGADSLRGQRGQDVFLGGGGADLLGDLEGRGDTLRGGGGADALRSMNGKADSLRGGSGADDIRSVDGEADSLRGGSGFDLCIGDRRDSYVGCERVIRG